MSNLTLHTPSALPSVQEFSTLKEIGQMAIRSGFLPQGIKTAEQAIIIMMKGRELGIPPMQAFSSIAVINGKPTMSAELMLSMIYRNVPGAVVDYLETTNEKCLLEAKRPGGKTTKFSFTMDDARRANLATKGPWVTYPAAMLRARAISAMARAMFADALNGVVYTPEEMGAEVDGEGEILEVPSEPAQATASPITSVEDLTEEPSAEDYVPTFGKFKGQRLGDLDVPDLANYVSWAEDNYRQKNESPKPHIAEFIRQAHRLIEERQEKFERGNAS